MMRKGSDPVKNQDVFELYSRSLLCDLLVFIVKVVHPYPGVSGT